MQGRRNSKPAVALAVLVAVLAGCAGDDDPAAAGAGAGGTLTIASANPATENTTVDTAKAATLGNDARLADGFSATLYCDVHAEAAPGASGRVHAVQVYFRQSDKAALHVSLVSSATASAPPSYVVFDNNGGAPITNVTVDAAARTVAFNAKVLAGSAGEAGTLSGTFAFAANGTGVAGCGV
ncbi:MAG: hypothetical protein J0L57_08150 [Burkholderiales bacterium]|nr:hypothetical protein [Burkholderiales bacterium]